MIVIFATLISLIALPFMSYALETTVDGKAGALNKLAILQGDGINFNLTGQLKRSEAITFIVRIMGEEANVKTNAAKYTTNTFSDVKATDWFAAYVGFCKEKNLLAGFPDGAFHPNDPISEKAFLKLVLGALGYIIDKNFVWDTIYESSFNLGVVSDVKYKTQDADNTQYLRSDVVEVLYNSLKININGLKKSIIQSLIEKNVVTQATAVQLGLVNEIIPTTINKIEVLNQANLNVTLNKTVSLIGNSDIVIYETDNKSNLLTASVTSQVYSVISINTSTQIPDKSYTLEVTTTDDSKNISKVTAVFKALPITEIKSDYFRISKIETVSKNILNVYFTQPIINNEAALPVYYDIYKNNSLYVKGSKNNMTVNVLASNNNAVSVYLKNALISDDALYSLKISGDISSAYGVQLNDGVGDSVIFTGQKLENPELKVNRVFALDSKTLNIEFNKDIDERTAEQTNNYVITHPNGTVLPVSKAVMSAAGKGKMVQLTITTTFDPAVNYLLKMSTIEDLLKISTIQDLSTSFSGKAISDLKTFKINSIAATDKATLQVSFDRKLDSNIANNAPYYLITGITDPNYITIPNKVYVNPQDYSKLTLYFAAGNEFIASNLYKLKVLNVVPDELGNISTLDTISVPFTGSSNMDIKPTLTEAIIIGKDTIKIKSSKELLDNGNNLTLNNYSLELKDGKNTFILKTPYSVTLYDATTLILQFDNLDLTKSYTFKFNSLTDITGLNVRSAADGKNSIILKNGENHG
ncbi:S-layer homology domain-containing protein [Paenibacillus psychroresistens]|nr:S-layer homology domain-containing protein [Paenibacillus psychroresistens]